MVRKFVRTQSCPIRTFRKARPITVEPSQPLLDQCSNKYPDMIFDVAGQTSSVVTDLIQDCIESTLAVQELPDKNTEGIEAHYDVLVRIEEQGPVVKLLPEPDRGVGYGFLIVWQGTTAPFRSPSRKQENPTGGRPFSCNLCARAGQHVEPVASAKQTYRKKEWP